MAKYVIDDSTLTTIADAIRGKTGKTDLLTLEQMASEIDGISGGGIEYSNSQTTEISKSAYMGMNLSAVSFTAVITIGRAAFGNCSALQEINFPVVTTIDAQAFANCSALQEINFPKLTSIGTHSFLNCSALITVDFPEVTSIESSSFSRCFSLTALILRRTDAICTLRNSAALAATPIENGTGYIYVPAALIDSYKADSVWSTYAAQFRALEDYTVDGTTTGALDPNKI